MEFGFGSFLRSVWCKLKQRKSKDRSGTKNCTFPSIHIVLYIYAYSVEGFLTNFAENIKSESVFPVTEPE